VTSCNGRSPDIFGGIVAGAFLLCLIPLILVSRPNSKIALDHDRDSSGDGDECKIFISFGGFAGYSCAMDDIDRNILLELQGNGAAGLAELAKVAGLSVSATAERVKRLEERGTIRGWRADLEPAAVGCPQLAWVFVMLQSGAEASFIAAMAADEAVLECHAISGRWSYQVKLRLPDLAAVDSFTNSRLRALPGVMRTETLVALATHKETSALPIAPADEEE
jgi:Lrp/AsnC family leucine-responsive transcriptional regulator